MNIENKGKIYWIIGQPASGKTTIGTKLYKFLQTEKRNWRRSVFHIDDNELRKLQNNTDYTERGRRKNITDAQRLAEFLSDNECDVVVSLVTPYLDIREEFKDKCGSYITEIYLHNSDVRDGMEFSVDNFEEPESNFIELNTTKDSVAKTFSKLIVNLTKLEKL